MELKRTKHAEEYKANKHKLESNWNHSERTRDTELLHIAISNCP